MKFIAYIGVMVIGLVLVIFAFNTEYLNKGHSNDGKTKISTSFYPIYFFTSEIVGDKADVINITPAGAEPHAYDLTAGDRVNIDKSKLLILVGKNFEPWGQRVADSLQGSETRVLELNRSTDPHFWLSPMAAKEKSAMINEAVKQIDVKVASFYDHNYLVLSAKFDQLHKDYLEGLKNCKRKDFITTHEAFSYLARDYGLNQVSLAGLSPDEEPSAKTIASIAQFAKKNNIKYIFFESLISPKLADTVANEIGAETLVLNPIEGLTKDEIASGKNYFTEMQKNLSNLRIALECQ